MGPYASSLLDYLALRLLRYVALGGLRPPDAYRTPGTCDLGRLGSIPAPAAVTTEPLPPWQGWTGAAFRFPSPLQGPDAECATVAGITLQAAPGAPWVVVVPGYATGVFPPHDFGFFKDLQARALLEAGLNVALVEPPLHMSRRRSGYPSGAGLFGPDLRRTQLAFCQGAGDIIAIVRWLRQGGRVPVAVWGTSMGGGMAALAATGLPELGALALLEPVDNPGEVMLATPGSRELLRRLAGPEGPDPEQLPEALRSVAPSQYQPALPRERILFVWPRRDRIVPPAFQEALWAAWGRPERWLLDDGHVTAVLNQEAARRVARWLAGHLGGAVPAPAGGEATEQVGQPVHHRTVE